MADIEFDVDGFDLVVILWAVVVLDSFEFCSQKSVDVREISKARAHTYEIDFNLSSLSPFTKAFFTINRHHQDLPANFVRSLDDQLGKPQFHQQLVRFNLTFDASQSELRRSFDGNVPELRLQLNSFNPVDRYFRNEKWFKRWYTKFGDAISQLWSQTENRFSVEDLNLFFTG